MKHVSLLVPYGNSSLVNIDATRQMLSWVNEHFRSIGKKPLFDLYLVGLAKSGSRTNRSFTITPDVVAAEVLKTDLIIIPSIHGTIDEIVKPNAAFIPWIVRQHQKGAEVAGLCIGSLFLAATGLLDGKQCTTHWHFATLFRELFPQARLMDNKIITEDSGIYTSGGAFAFTNLIIYLIEKYAGRDVAIEAAKAFVIDIERASQLPFTVFKGQKTHKDSDVLSIQEYIENHYNDRLTVEQLCKKVAVGRRTFERKFKKATANTIVEYIQRVRIEAAKRSFEATRKNVTDVMFDVGYTDTKAFRTVFKKVTGLTPVEYRSKYAHAISLL